MTEDIASRAQTALIIVRLVAHFPALAASLFRMGKSPGMECEKQAARQFFTLDENRSRYRRRWL
jgi:hypothetical protein